LWCDWRIVFGGEQGKLAVHCKSWYKLGSEFFVWFYFSARRTPDQLCEQWWGYTGGAGLAEREIAITQKQDRLSHRKCKIFVYFSYIKLKIDHQVVWKVGATRGTRLML